MKQILKKLYKNNAKQVCKDIQKAYKEKKHIVIQFLYFSNAMKYRLFEKTSKKKNIQYKKSLLKGDFLLPDGIALQCFYRRNSIWSRTTNTSFLYNLNGTDLTPKLLQSFDPKDSHFAIMSFYDPSIKKDKFRLKKGAEKIKKNYNIEIDYISQSLYKNKGKDIDRKAYQESINKKSAKNNILILCLGTPLQELLCLEKQDFFKKNHVLTICSGGRIDFVSGYEKRAPKRLVKIRVGETAYRIITNPRKNLKKFLAMFGIFRLLIPAKTRKIILKKS